MDKFFISLPHRRYNPLKDEFVLVSPQRTKRPWQGKQDLIKKNTLAKYDPNCYLCPGNFRANNVKNHNYYLTYVFDNDYPAITENSGTSNYKNSDLFRIEKAVGTCRVVCFSPRHDLTLANMTVTQIEEVIKVWIKEINDLREKYQWVQIFENKGELMGCSNPHPHGQIWASNFIPNEIEKEDKQQKKYYKTKNTVMLADYLRQELKIRTRVVLENDNWVVVVPFWAIWPFETILLPKRHIPSFVSVSKNEIFDLAKIMKNLLITYDKLFNTSMPYSMGWHFAPFNGKNNNHWQLHAHYYPPLLRSATIKKYIVGYEMLAEAQRDLTAEQSVERLRKIRI